MATMTTPADDFSGNERKWAFSGLNLSNKDCEEAYDTFVRVEVDDRMLLTKSVRLVLDGRAQWCLSDPLAVVVARLEGAA